jgi:oligopeptide transport system substrate-binding protein
MEANPGERRALLEEAERVLLKDSPVIPLYFYVSKHLVKPQIHGWNQNIMDVVYSKDLTRTAPPQAIPAVP